MCVVTCHRWTTCNHEVVTRHCRRTNDKAQHRPKRRSWRLLSCFSSFDDDSEPTCRIQYENRMNVSMCPGCHTTLATVMDSRYPLVGAQRGRHEHARAETPQQQHARQEQEVRREAEEARAPAEARRVRQQQREAREREKRKRLEARERELKKKNEAEQMIKQAKERARQAAEQYGWATSQARQGYQFSGTHVAPALYRKRFDALPPVEPRNACRLTQTAPASAKVIKAASGHASSGRQGSPSIAERRRKPVTPVRIPGPPPMAKVTMPKPKSQVPLEPTTQARVSKRARREKTSDPVNGFRVVDGEDGREFVVIKKDELAAQVKQRPVHEVARDFGHHIPTYRRQVHEKSDQYGEPLPSDDFLDDMARYN